MWVLWSDGEEVEVGEEGGKVEERYLVYSLGVILQSVHTWMLDYVIFFWDQSGWQ